MAAPTLDHDAILATIRKWPREAQLALARDILDTALAPAEESQVGDEAAHSQGSWRNLIGLLATDQPPPTDEEIERWREEWRMEKYGR